jgi:hypothetical protein
MADETNTANSGAEQDTATATDNSGEQQRTFTQADLDRIVTERLAKEKQRAEAQATKARADAERKAAEEQGQWQKLAEQYKTEAEAERQRAQAATLAVLRRDIAAKMNVPAVLADRLQGNTAEEMEADAKSLLAGLPKASLPTANAGAGAKQPGIDSKNMNAFIRAAAGRTQ